ncbi:MAG TPA: c-type cytochrome, partial [Thermomicrobiales bacterium]|nr:c-type cytochrome [Thermomicrobiales bacterium]
GDWQIQLTVLMPGQPDWVVSTTQTVSTGAAANQIPPPPPLFGLAGIAALGLLILGIVGIAFAVFGGTPVFRKEAAGLGTAALVAGMVILFQARLSAEVVAAIDPSPAVSALDPAAVVRGEALFAQNCVLCHGAGGRGDGPGAASLTRPPADLTSGHALPHSDDDYAYWIENGIEGTDMPGFGAELGEEGIRDVIAYIRGLQQTTLLARDAPGAEECTIAPRTLAEFETLAQSPAPEDPPDASETGGEQVDEATRAAVAATARELVACSNAGDILRRLALYSDDRLRFAYPDGPTRALEMIAESPLPLSLADRVALVSVDDVRQFADGRVGARVTVDNPASHSHDPQTAATASQQEVARLIFVQEDGRWRVDETRREDATTDATPITGPSGP